MFLASQKCPGFLYWRASGFCQSAFLNPKRWTCGFCVSVCLYSGDELGVKGGWGGPLNGEK